MKKLQLIPFKNITIESWTNFYQYCRESIIFYQYPFLEAFEKATQNEVDVLLYTQEDKILIALPGRYDKDKNIFFNLTHLGWDNLHFLIQNNVSTDTLVQFFNVINKKIDLFVFKNISEDCFTMLNTYFTKNTSFKRFICPYIQLPKSYQSFLESLSTSFRRMVKNRTNFCEKHGVTFSFIFNNEKKKFEKAYENLINLHAKRLDVLGYQSKFLRPESQKYHTVLRQETNKKFIFIIQASKDDKVIGTLYGFLSADKYGYFASGIDNTYSKFSLGVVMIGKVIDFLISNGYQTFDFLRGSEEYKFKWTNDIDQNYTIYCYKNIHGKRKALTHFWYDNKKRWGRKETILRMKKFIIQ